MRRTFLFVLVIICFSNVYSQNILRGVIVDQDEKPISNTKIAEGSGKNFTFSDFEGKFILHYFSDESTLTFSSLGCDSLKMAMPGTDNIVVFLTRQEGVNPYNLAGYTGYTDFLVKNANKHLETMPYLFGESDINRQLQMLPGVEQGNEGYSNLFVRGGEVDQNLMMYNGTPIYNFNHIFGLSSVFHNRSIDNTRLYKGISPAKFGGRASSYISLESAKNASFSKFEGELEISPLNAGIYIENINKDKNYFTVSARRSWIDLLFPTESRQNDFNFNFYDLQVNYGQKLDKNNRIDFSIMSTRDLYFLAFNDTSNNQYVNYGFTQQWGNLVSSVKYSHRYNDNFNASHSLHYSGYQSQIKLSEEVIDRSFVNPFSEDKLERGVRDVMAISDWDYLRSNTSAINFGLQANIRSFLTGKELFSATNYPGQEDIYSIVGSTNYEPSIELSAYAENHSRQSDDFGMDYGIRTTFYNYSGFSKFVLEPRFNISYNLKKNDVVKFAYNRHNQFLSQLNVGTIGSPNNIWVPATSQLAPQKLDIIEASYEKALGRDYSGTLNIFFKSLSNLSEVSNLDDAADPQNNWEQYIFEGDGSAYGAELMLQKNNGLFTGWISYTYGKSDRYFADLQDEPYLFSYDRTHMMKMYINFTSDDEWNFGMNYILGSGQLFTVPIGKFNDIDGNTQLQYDELNNYRSPAYQRLDISVVRNKNYFLPEQQWKFYLYNVLGTRNPININPTFPNGGLTSLVIERTYIAFVPGVAYIVKF
jgi:hypothetical protein